MALTLNGTSGITGAGIGTIGPSGANVTGVVTCTSVVGSGAISGTTGTFTGAVSGTTGTFTGNVTGGGDINCETGYYQTTSGTNRFSLTHDGANCYLENQIGSFYVKSVDNANPLEVSNNAVTLNNANLVIGTSGKGIDFSADGNASGSSSEILDDYEEGSWTPADGGGVVPFSEAVGRYRKIGNLVVCAMFLRCNNNVTDGGNAYVVGLPFTSENTDGAGHGGFAIGATNITQLHSAHVNKNSSLFYFYDSSYNNIGRSTMWDGDSTNKRLIAVLTYFTT